MPQINTSGCVNWSQLGQQAGQDNVPSQLTYGTTTAATPLSATPGDKSRLTFISPVESSIFSLGCESEHTWGTSEETRWKGAAKGVTLGSRDVVGIVGGKEIVLAATPVSSGWSDAETAKEGFEGRLLSAEIGVFTQSALMTLWSGDKNLLKVFLKIGAKTYKGVKKFGTHEKEDGVLLSFGKAEHVSGSNGNVASISGNTNLVFGSAKAELAAGFASNVVSGFKAEVSGFAKASVEGMVSVGIESDIKTELAARRGKAEVIGELVEIGGTGDKYESSSMKKKVMTALAPLYGNHETKVVAVEATENIELKVEGHHGDQSIIVGTQGVDIGVGHEALLRTRGDAVSMTSKQSGVHVGANRVRICVRKSADEFKATPADPKTLPTYGAKGFASNMAEGVSFAVQAAIPLVKKLAPSDVAYGSTALVSTAALYASGMYKHRTALAHEIAQLADETTTRDTALDTFWAADATGPDVEHPHIEVTEDTSRVAADGASVGVAKGVVNIKAGDEASMQLQSATPADKVAATSKLAGAQAALGVATAAWSAAKTAKNTADTAYNTALIAPGTVSLDALLPLAKARTAARDSLIEAERLKESAQGKVSAAQAQIALLDNMGFEVKVPSGTLTIKKTKMSFVNTAGKGFSLSATGQASINDVFDVLP